MERKPCIRFNDASFCNDRSDERKKATTTQTYTKFTRLSQFLRICFECEMHKHTQNAIILRLAVTSIRATIFL